MKRFLLHRIKDVSGVSGTGVVAEGIQFSSGKAVVSWLTDISSIAIYDCVEDVIKIHGHSGSTELVWIKDGRGNAYD